MKDRTNTILLSDAYKYTHWMQYIDGLTKMRAYIESRGTKLTVNYTKVVGLQGFLKRYLKGKVLKEWMIVEAKELLGEVFGTHEYFNEKAFRRLLEKHKGRLPLSIRSVREGTRVPLKNVLLVIENTDDEFPWLTQWVETMLLRAMWYPKAVCTISTAVRDLEKKYAAICGCGLNPFFLNDFGARGVSSHESAEIGGLAHLASGYLGTDTIEAIRYGKLMYGPTATGYSVFASEHSTTTIYGKLNEVKAYKNFLTKAPKDKIVSIVIDSYHDEVAVKELLGNQCKELILERTAFTVFRPDSGNPVTKSLDVINWLWDIFGGTINQNGFKVLNPKVKVIYGDGLNLQVIEEILQNLVDNKISIENICFGMGGKLLQGVDRDTFEDACKVCSAVINGEEVEIYKDPYGNTGKKSKRGQLKLIKLDGVLTTVKLAEYPKIKDELIQFFLDGKVTVRQTFKDIRNRD